MGIIQSKDWVARQTTDPVGSKYTLTVTGQVEVSAGNIYPVLSRAEPQGIVAETLLLCLGERQSGDVGTDALTWRTATYSQEVTHGQYTQVQIAGHDTVDVEIIHS